MNRMTILKSAVLFSVVLALPTMGAAQSDQCLKAVQSCIAAYSGPILPQVRVVPERIVSTCKDRCSLPLPIPISCELGEGLFIYDQFDFASGASSLVDSQIRIALERKLSFLPEVFSVEVIGSADPFPFENTVHSEHLWKMPFKRCQSLSAQEDNACLAVERALSIGKTVSDWLSEKTNGEVRPLEHLVRSDPFMSAEFERLGDCLHGKMVNGMSLLARADMAKAAILEVSENAVTVNRSLSESTLRGCALENSVTPCLFADAIGTEKGKELIDWMAPFRSVIVLFVSQ